MSPASAAWTPTTTPAPLRIRPCSVNPIDPSQIDLLRRTQAQLLPAAAEFSVGFLDHLFCQDPALRRLFPGDINARACELMNTIQAVMDVLDKPTSLAALCRELGQRHRACGAEEAHYDQVGIALLRTLRDALGAHYTEEVEAAWAGAYGEIAEAMIASAPSPGQGVCRVDTAGCAASMD